MIDDSKSLLLRISRLSDRFWGSSFFSLVFIKETEPAANEPPNKLLITVITDPVEYNL